MARKSIFCGAATALITPFKDSKTDYESLERIIEYQIDGGIDALVVAGTTGESATLSESEQKELIRFAKERIGGRVPTIAGTGSCDTEKAVRLSRYASDIGCDALLVVTPYYNKATEDGIYRSYKAIAENSDIPIILYNVPSRTSFSLTRQMYRRLADIENIIAVKEASGDLAAMSALMSEFSDRFDLYSGSDEVTLPVMSIGGKGVISVLSNIMPAEVSRLCGAYADGDCDGARRLQLELIPLIEALFCEVNPIPVKYAMHLMGFCRNEYRLPLCEPSEASKEKIAEVLREYSLLK